MMIDSPSAHISTAALAIARFLPTLTPLLSAKLRPASPGSGGGSSASAPPRIRRSLRWRSSAPMSRRTVASDDSVSSTSSRTVAIGRSFSTLRISRCRSLSCMPVSPDLAPN